jgi:hypothetical protein
MTFRTMALLGLFALGTSACFAQFETSEVLGTVRDTSQKPVGKATVTLTNQDTHIEAKTTTDENGEYDFFNVKVGRYTVTVELTGFSKFSSSDISVEVNARQRVDAVLQVGSVTETVTVNGTASLVETDTSELSQVIGTEAITELPLNGRQYSTLALLSTNVHISPMALGLGVTATPREGAFNVNGMRSTYNNFLMDGLDNNSYGTSNQDYSSQVVQPSPDALAEFRVITSDFSAEYGRVGGGVVNAVMRSGTDDFHGTLYEFLRNTDLNAAGFFRAATKPTFHRNQFGVTLGGPMIKNKLFFFVDYEGFRQAQGFVNSYSVPSVGDREGILSVTVVNPLTGVVYPAGTQIPVAQINPFAAAGLAGLPPAANLTRSNNIVAIIPFNDNIDKYDSKLDYQIADNMTAFLRWSQRKDIAFLGPDDPGASGGDNNGYIHAIQQQAAAGYTWTVSPTSLLEGRLGFTHVLGGKEPPYLGGPDIAAEYGILGEPSSLAGGFPTQVITGFSNPTFGRQATNPQFQNPTSWNPKLNYSFVRGKHSIKAGYEFLMVRTEVLDINPLYGQDTYNGQYSKPTCAELGQAAGCSIASNATSYDLADFYFGIPSAITQGSNLTTNLRQHVHSLYLQDDWRVTPKLTINAGLRWEFATPIWDRDNYWSNFDPATNSLVRATKGSLFDRALVDPNYKDFGPRLGLAYSVDPKTVIRAGFGISYAFFNRPGSAMEGINGPLAVFGSYNNPTAQPPVGGAGYLTVFDGFNSGIGSTFNPLTTNNDYIPADDPWPMVQSWVFSIQREVARDTVIELAYNGNHTIHLPILGDWNQAATNPVTATCNGSVTPAITSGCLGIQARRPDQSFDGITWVDPAGINSYNGLSLRVEHRFSQGLYLLNSFTWGKAIGDSEQALEYYSNLTGANPQNINDLAAERAPTSYSAKWVNVTSIVYQLPFGRGKQFAGNVNRFVDAAIGGWEINTINTSSTGLPINVYYTPSSFASVSDINAEYRGEPFLRPNVSGTLAGQSITNYFAGYTFTVPSLNSPFGDLGRNAFFAPGIENWDLGLTKNFTFTERFRMQFRSEFFNLPNHTNFGPPNNILSNSNFGTITTQLPSRQIQFGLKLLF